MSSFWPLGWPNATVVSGDAVDVVARLEEESEVPLRSHGCLSLKLFAKATGSGKQCATSDMCAAYQFAMGPFGRAG